MTTATLFSEESIVFEEHREEWFREHPGKFVVIQNEEVLDEFFGTYAEAFKAGLDNFGVQKSFMVKQIWKTEPVYCIS